MPPESSWTRCRSGRDEHRAEPVLDDPVHREKVERPDLDAQDLLGGKRLLEPFVGVTGTARQQKRDRLVAKPAEGELQRGHRRAVEPLRVVDRHEQRPLGRKGTKRVQQARADRPPVGAPSPRALEQERRLERAPLGRRQLADDVPERRAQEVGEARERELGLALSGSGAQHA